MNKKQYTVNTLEAAIKKGETLLNTAKELTTCLELLLIAANGFKEIVKQHDGGNTNE